MRLKQVAELVGVSVSTIGLYESNERLPSLPVLVKGADKRCNEYFAAP